MSDENTETHIKDAVGVFDSERDLEAAVDALLTSGFNRADLSLLAGEQAVKEKLGHAYRDVRELEDDPAAPSIAYVPRESIGDAQGAVIGAPMYVVGVTAAGMVAAAGGPLTIGVAAVAAAAGAGAALGVVLAGLIGRRRAEFIENQLDHGGLLLWVRTWDAREEEKAVKILQANNASDVHIHDFSVNAEAVMSPESILMSGRLSDSEKTVLLRQWEYDVRQLLVAESEGMGDANGDLLSRILNALAALGDGPDG
ncbi:MAG: hypothetical protein AAFX54_02885 [Pseudomonadota bacterium]